MGSSSIAQGDQLSALCPHRGVGEGGWEREGGRETQEGGDMGMYVYV